MSDEEKEPVQPQGIPRRTPEEITTLAREMIQGRYFVPPDSRVAELSFGMLFAFGTFEQQWWDDLGLVFEDVSKAGPWAVNGYPQFFSMQTLHKDDVPLLQAEYRRMAEAIGLPTEPEPTEAET